jgi:hypothetical protein
MLTQPKCKACGASHHVAKDKEMAAAFKARGGWKGPGRPVEKMKYAGMEAHVRSGEEHTAHIVTITYREHMKANKVIIEGGYRCCLQVLPSTALLPLMVACCQVPVHVKRAYHTQGCDMDDARPKLPRS